MTQGPNIDNPEFQDTKPADDVKVGDVEPKVDDLDPLASSKALLAKLDEYGINSESQLDGSLKNSQQFGRQAYVLGQERQRAAQLEQELQLTRQQLAQRQPDQGYSDQAYDQQQSVDLGGLMDDRLEKFWTRKQQEQAGRQQVMTDVVARIVNDPEYPMIKDDFEAHMATPEMQQRINQGVVDPGREYHRFKLSFYKENLAKTTAELRKAVDALQPDKKQPPHVEGSQSQSPQRRDVNSEDQARISDLKKRATGKHEDLHELTKILIKDDDPILG